MTNPGPQVSNEALLQYGAEKMKNQDKNKNTDNTGKTKRSSIKITPINDGTDKQIKRTYVRKKPYVNWRKEKDSAGPPKDKENEGYEETNKNKWFNSKFTPGFNEPKTLTEDKENIYPISDDESDIDTNSNIDFGKFKDSSRVVASRVTTSDIYSKENDSYKNDKIMPDELSNMESTTQA